ncbi:MAG: hypothetical protein ACP5US_05050 [Candidatus Kryptoniota bacterium]
MKRKIKVIQFGVGDIGENIVKALLQKDHSFELVGAVDNNPKKIGKDIGVLIGYEGLVGVVVSPDLQHIKRKADIAIHTSVSFLPEASNQVIELLKSGYNVISTAEELFFLEKRDRNKFNYINSLAKRNHLRVLVSGVNPGYVLDTLVLVASAPVIMINSIRAERTINLSHRRLALQRKLGVGLSKYEFSEQSSLSPHFGPVGLTDSADFVLHHLNMKYDTLRSVTHPIIADHDYKDDNIFVARDHVLGVRQEVIAMRGDEEILSFRLTMRIDSPIEYDHIFIDGEPPVNIVINNGIMGDKATVGIVLNLIPILLDLSPGFHTVANIRLPHHFNYDHTA